MTKSTRLLYPREESSYRNMMTRCNNPKSPSYVHYGARGIKVCEEWADSFYTFLSDMGERPEGTSLDRIDTDGDYTPENCRWADLTTQARNTRRNHLITHDGETLCVSEWSDRLGINQNTLVYRLRRGWPVARALGKEAERE